MTLEQVSYASQIVGVVLVFASLVFVGIETMGDPQRDETPKARLWGRGFFGGP
jgi:hypothetical protein